jgi:hypothetical protein
VIHTDGAIGSLDNPFNKQLMGAIDYLNKVYDGTMPGIDGVGDIQIQCKWLPIGKPYPTKWGLRLRYIAHFTSQTAPFVQ